MVYTFIIDIVYWNLNSIFNNLNAITMKYQFLANKNTKSLDIEPHGFLKIVSKF